LRGAGIKVDIPNAREMLTFAAAKGDEQSARMLGMMDRGEGMFKNLKRKAKTR
jgi:TPR repeat protein